MYIKIIPTMLTTYAVVAVNIIWTRLQKQPYINNTFFYAHSLCNEAGYTRLFIQSLCKLKDLHNAVISGKKYDKKKAYHLSAIFSDWQESFSQKMKLITLTSWIKRKIL